ncbi:DUF6525 family protein [Paracoccus ravus]|uniref:DUF6525 family protein n=1 Tax=Paracoccus ravus TaxID=2447760 RepID=UPI00106DF95B|nr:DUF6525 family protein [Paracoccus ravus]
MSPRNLSTSLRCRSTARPMEDYDRLPPELSRWVSTAALPWSAKSVLRLWSRLHRETGGDTSGMIRRIWGKEYVEQACISAGMTAWPG